MPLAQLNIAKAKYPLDAPEIADFVDNIPTINALAEASAGFIWRLKDDGGDATSFVVFDDPSWLVNLSVWRDVESLKHFMLKTHHVDFMKRKREWFEPQAEATYVLWWVPQGHIPTVSEAIERLMHLRQHGDSAQAFSFRTPFAPS